MNSATSTERAPSDADPGFRAWHIYALLSMIAATVAVILTRQTHPVALLLLSGAVLAAGVVGVAVHQALLGFTGRDEARVEPLGDHARDVLVRDKMLVLRAIKELEFDHAMGKVDETDFQDLSRRLRLRALALMQELERGPGDAGHVAPVARADDAVATASPRCASCGTANDRDARFCKQCGRGLAPS